MSQTPAPAITPEATLKQYPVVVVTPVAWGDMDAFAHVNNTVYFRWFETARIAYFERILLDIGTPKGVGPILASTSCRFKVPLTYPDTVHLGARVRELGDDRFVMEYAVFSARQGRLAARGEGLVVSYDYKLGRKAPVPPEWRARVMELEAEPPARLSR